ncbi:hypothetical protein CEXT_240021 [Caerostris extrusa]|uniref:Uncharacterized protein n=1 Tax=Caerostris extrusa TaxID=172846 RepID=A0AAV4MJB4_CAEEX|nr:hypothetical protein CEXT_240021 [Caerostris extrusa]
MYPKNLSPGQPDKADISTCSFNFETPSERDQFKSKPNYRWFGFQEFQYDTISDGPKAFSPAIFVVSESDIFSFTKLAKQGEFSGVLQKEREKG